ncbi:TPA: hypothetical protein ACHYEQ_004218, partial [Salmonella enterica]
KKNTKWHVFYRRNSGEERLLGMSSFQECLSASAELMTPSNYMICIKRNGERIKRWDREIIAGSNKWLNCPPDSFEILGELITINKVSGNNSGLSKKCPRRERNRNKKTGVYYGFERY